MSSNRKLAANKRNGCKSSGPRTAAGKKKASRNALKHGLSAVVHRQPALPPTSSGSPGLSAARVNAPNSSHKRV